MKAEYISCNLCGTNSAITLYESDFANMDEMDHIAYNYTVGKNQFKIGRIVRCKKCGLVYVNPRPQNTHKNYECEDVDDRYLNSFAQRIKTFTSDLSLVHKMRNLPLPGCIIDIGCSSGDFLHLAKARGWDVAGIELNKEAFRKASQKGLKIYNQPLDSVNFGESLFDVATLWGVIEHFPDPLGELNIISRILKRGGLIFITTALLDTFFARIMGKKHPSFIGQHLYYFTSTTIKKMLKKADFEVVKIVPHRQFLQPRYIAGSMLRYNQIGRILGAPLKAGVLKNIFLDLSLLHIESMIVAAKRH